MRTGLVLIAAVIVAAIVADVALFFAMSRTGNAGAATVVGLGGYSYNVLSAVNQDQWRQGLMNYTFACATPGGCVNGMLFVFPSDTTWCFWMKNTPEPLAQIWISNGTVTSVYNGTPESTTSVCGIGNEVLELYSKLPMNLSVGEAFRTG